MVDYKILSRRTTIINQLGMHARPAAMIAKLAQSAEDDVWIGDGDNRADASSIIDILSLGCSKGYEVLLEAESEEDIPILDSIKELIETGFGEDVDE
ncbi:MAG: HPr family phosphocarrier protein [Desulfobacteraceae bacterium]|nr:HPr family phosphocarrier protein [Desulfobacteraceae bacterium]